MSEVYDIREARSIIDKLRYQIKKANVLVNKYRGHTIERSEEGREVDEYISLFAADGARNLELFKAAYSEPPEHLFSCGNPGCKECIHRRMDYNYRVWMRDNVGSEKK